LFSVLPEPGSGAPDGKRPWSRTEVLGVVLLIASMALLLFNPKAMGDFFDAAINKAMPIVVDVFLTGYVGFAIIASVMAGRILERFGFTDALLRVFMPIAAKMGMNPAVVVPGVYNIIGDINAAGVIAGPVTKKSGCTVDEQKIAVATMVQVQQSLATFILGIMAVTAAGVRAFPVVLLAVFLPMIAVPFILSRTIYRNVRRVPLSEIPCFTPKTPIMDTLFGSAMEGAKLLFLFIIPAVGAVYAVIGGLEYLHIWQPIEQGLSWLLGKLLIDPATGITSMFIAPTLAAAQLLEGAAGIAPALVVGSFVLASSGLPASVITGQIPVIWAEHSDLTQSQALEAAILGTVMRILSATAIAWLSVRIFMV